MSPDARRDFGDVGERRAAQFLEAKGLSVLAVQEKTPFGEIDLVCQDGDEIVFVEVKTRRSASYGYPEEAVTRAKFSHMAQSAEAYLAAHNWLNRPWRLDVVSVEWEVESNPILTHFPGIDMPAGSW